MREQQPVDVEEPSNSAPMRPSRQLENLFALLLALAVLGLLIFTAGGNRPFIYVGF